MNGVNDVAYKTAGSVEGFVTGEHMLKAKYGNFDGANNLQVQATQNNFRSSKDDGKRTVKISEILLTIKDLWMKIGQALEIQERQHERTIRRLMYNIWKLRFRLKATSRLEA